MNNLDHLSMEQGNHERAAELLEEGLRLFYQLGNNSGIAGALNNLARLALETGDHSQAASLLARVEAQSEAMGALLPDDCQQNLEAARSQIGEEAFTDAWRQGREMTLEQAVALALANPPGYGLAK